MIIGGQPPGVSRELRVVYQELVDVVPPAGATPLAV